MTTAALVAVLAYLLLSKVTDKTAAALADKRAKKLETAKLAAAAEAGAK